jgi:anti-anti-sigma factor
MPTVSASHASAPRRAGRPSPRFAARSRLRCVARDLAPGIIEVALAGNLDMATALRADRALRAAQADAEVVVLDLREVQLIGRTAARVALMANGRARRGEGRLVVVASPAPGPRLFGLARLHRRLELVDHSPTTYRHGTPA